MLMRLVPLTALLLLRLLRATAGLHRNELRGSRPPPPPQPAPEEAVSPHGRVIFVRHGQSTWNADGRFTGWDDIPLTEGGRTEARAAAVELRRRGFLSRIDRAFASELERSQETLAILLKGTECRVDRDWRLNERHYGSLQGMSKQDAVDKYGITQVKRWRNSFDQAPPPLAPEDPRHPAQDAKYAQVPPNLLPSGECLRDTLHRVWPFWEDRVRPELARGKTVLVVAHGHSIRALVKVLDGISDTDIACVAMPNAIPLLYEFDADLRPLRRPHENANMSLLSGSFLGDDAEVQLRLDRDAQCVGDDCSCPTTTLPAPVLLPTLPSSSWVLPSLAPPTRAESMF